MHYQARAPLRIDFGGAWTDCPEFDEAGAVLSAAITRYAHGSISQPSGTGVVRVLRSDRSYLSYSVDVPPRAGLGASAAQTVLWTTLVRTTVENTSSRLDVADMASHIAENLRILRGKQDEYASALGGFNYLTFTDRVMVERLNLEPSVADALRARLLLVYSGPSRLTTQIYDDVWRRYRAGEAIIRSSLKALAGLAGEMKSALLARDLETFGTLIGETWTRQRELHPAITTPEIEDLVAHARAAGAVAGKACGLGGGGCVLLFAGEGRAAGLSSVLQSRRQPVLEFDFDTYGVHLRKA